jgi:AraC-like DNA-binding protein
MMSSNPTRPPGGRIERLDHAEPARIWKARCFIHEHLGEELSLAKVADFVTISPNYLSEEFKRVTGSKFVDYIARTRVEKACELLSISNLRISEIAFEVGFQSLSQFNRAFKRLSGKSPTEYRAAGGDARQALSAPRLLQCSH